MPNRMPTEVTTSEYRCLASATSAAERPARPARISRAAQPALSAVDRPVSARASQGATSAAGSRQLTQACCRMDTAATMISAPSMAAEKNSTFSWPYGWLSSAGRAA